MPRALAALALAAGLTAAAVPAPASADSFTQITDRGTFVTLVNGRELTYALGGIRLRVSPSGQIAGRAFGQPVTGSWNWQGRYFCRELRYGNEVIPANCQRVEVRSSTVRFTADRGTGDVANLRLR
ncbi:dihydrodipicolinate reductase [Rhodobacteraceae bacterium CCMM004]|nr:dihydrodipicolinate reductase [Rhodobacteraceae bacterium CCMM004]